MGLLSAAGERGSCKVLRVQYACTILLCLTVVVYCFFAFSIGVIDSNSRELYNQPPSPWPTLPSPLRARPWRVLQSSSAPFNQPAKPVVVVEKALQGMGTLFRKGSRPMRELIVAHLSEDTSLASLRLFLRTLHRSGSTARADVVVLFPGASVSQEVAKVFHEEEASFQSMLGLSDPKTASKRRASDESNSTLTPFNSMVFKRAEEEQHVRGDVMWGRRSNDSQPGDTKRTWSGYGSIASFEMQDLDPHNALSGFFDDPPAQLRRWVCYDMLLGMVRTKYRNVLLTQVKGVLFVGDALAAVRRRQHLYMSAEDWSWLDLDAEEFLETERSSNPGDDSVSVQPLTGTGGASVHRRALLEEVEEETDTEDVNPPKPKSEKKKKVVEEHVQGLIPSIYGSALWRSLDKAHKEKVVVSSGFAMGRIEYVRKLANKMTTEIVRIAIEKKNRKPFHDKAVLNYLVHQSSVLGKRVLDHMKIVPNRDSVVHSLLGSKQPQVFWKRRGKATRYAIIQGLISPRPDSDSERGRKIVAALQNDICQSPAESKLYHGCSPCLVPGLYTS